MILWLMIFFPISISESLRKALCAVYGGTGGEWRHNAISYLLFID